VLALAEAGAARVDVLARRPDEALAAAALAGKVGGLAEAEMLGEADLLVNATPVGMTTDGLPFGIDPERLGPGQLVADLIYAPDVTVLMAAARERGALPLNGVGMLIHQAARQFRSWTGQDAPVEAMSAAALAELGRRAGLA